MNITITCKEGSAVDEYIARHFLHKHNLFLLGVSWMVESSTEDGDDVTWYLRAE